jgi:hypothetical protein
MSLKHSLITDVLLQDALATTTAARLIKYFESHSIDHSDISGNLLKPIYDRLTKSSHTALGLELKFPVLAPSTSPLNDKVWGIIVETRKHPAIEFLVNHFSRQLGIGIQVFHGTENESFIRESSISRLIDDGRVVLSSLKTESLPSLHYNRLLLSMDFWKAIIGRDKILVFQTDSIVCPDSDYHLDDFLAFDYIGSKWKRERPVGMIIDGGNGGLSFRDWTKSVDCLSRFSPGLWPGGEDGYFAFHMDLMGCKVGRGDECAQFSTQNEFLYKSFGGHKLTELNPESMEQFIQYCPDIKYFS